MLKLSFKQQVLTGFVVSLIFVLISGVSSYLSINSLNNNSNWVNHSNEILHIAQKAETELLSAESSLRGYIITKDDHYYKKYTISSNLVLPKLASLKKLAADNPNQLRIIDTLEDYANLKLDEMKSIIRFHKESKYLDAKQTKTIKDGEEYKQHYLKASEKFVNDEIELLRQRKLKTADDSKRTILVIIFSSIIIFGLILFLLRYIRTTFTNQKKTEEEILKTNIELAQISTENAHNNWLLSGAAEINEAMRGQQKVDQLANNIISRISKSIDATIGSIFLKDEYKDQLNLAGTYAYSKLNKKSFAFGEGLIGQTALEKKAILIDNIPDNYIKINSSIGDAKPNYIYVVPIIYENETLAVAEFGFFNKPEEKKLNLINTVAENIGIAINSAVAHLQLQHLFEQTQQQAEELASQQEELRTTNEELMHKTEALQASEEELRVQQEELQQANTELEEKAQQLEEKNISINQAKEAISLKASELEVSSKYKSEFLANMSHELRTPLNSILILARILKDNRPENLTEDQIKYAGVIYNAGTDLLTLINDILDLSKIESGNVDLHVETVRPLEVKRNIDSLFAEVANNKKINFSINLKDNLPSTFKTDQGRLEQVIKNLLSNAFKFTPENGKINLEIGLAKNEDVKTNLNLKNQNQAPIYFSVKDNGIGISKDKLGAIFGAFQQEDGSTSRKYGGTGLGLSICKELAQILNGEIQLESEVGTGSTFTLLIPQNLDLETVENKPTDINEVKAKEENITILPEPIISTNASDNVLLIIEDDEVFADVLKDYALEKGFNPVLAHSGDIGLAKAIEIIPDAIVLDIMLPVMDGWAVLKKLKANPLTSHIPVHMMSAGNEKISKAEKEGAIGFLKKPIDKDKLDQAFELLMKQNEYVFNKVLIIEDQILQSNTLTEQLIKKGAKVCQAYTGKEALEILEEQIFDCIILDLRLPDISGFELLDQIKSKPELIHIPVIINTAMELNQEKMAHIMKYSEAMVLKSSKSNDRLLDEVSLFMNKLQNQSQISTSTYAAGNKKITKQVSTQEKALKDKTILITDDDMRNIFALSSALQAYEINIIIANNGKEALTKLDEHPEIDLVLMDIMMPEMDGYEAMQQIRLQKKFAKMPIIALTAKAMKNDKEKCIEAGANDYISKPVDVDKLLSLLRVWLS
jgi:CheY-like chemotaxis protein/signal transduction histidine kinase/CHASE3 domain sensor protein